MYQVKLLNDGIETIINAVSTRTDAPRVTGSIKHGINTIDSFSFVILPNNNGFNAIKPLKTLVEVFDIRSNKLEFKGRVLLPVPKMSSDGLLSISVICESELGYLMDSNTRYGEYHDISVYNFLKTIIDNHNSGVTEEKRFKLGNVTVTGNLYRFTKYEKTLTSIKDNLLSRLGGELQIRYVDGVRYLDYLKEIGEFKETDICISKNLKTIEQERDPSQIITRLVPLGAKLVDSEERLNIKSIANGVDYIDDDAAIDEFGIVEEFVIWDDVTIVDNLLRKGQEYLKENNKIKKKHKIDALDLSIIGLDLNSYEVGNTHNVINPLMNINEELRIIEKTIDISNPQNSSLAVGDKFEDIKDYQLNNIRTSKNLDTLKGTVNSAIDLIGNTNTDLTNTVEVVNNTIEVLNNTNSTVYDLNQSLIAINESLQTNINTTLELSTITNEITEKVNTTNVKLDKLRRRVSMEV